MKIHRIEVELLRAGPPHNQLLSPLTQYLGVYGESEAAVVTLPWEQYKFERRQQQLRYEGGTGEDAPWRLELLRDTGAEIAGILGQITGLPGALGSSGSSEALLHLRLVISASELALLPWELTRVPEGAPIPADDWLLLQAYLPVCLTRHIRSVPTTQVGWPAKLRLLVVTGDPGDLDPALENQLEALDRACEPWCEPRQADAGGRPWPEGWTLLENASIREVEQACGSAFEEGKPYTHVHVLAHGAEDETTEATSFGLLLKDPEAPDSGGADVVSGERFAKALTAGGGHPAVVTLASCDSGNQAEVVAPGSSFAHALHQAGIPLVVASQFPLSMEGSVALVERLYTGLLWGENPLPLLYRLRTELHSRFGGRSHDWASLVVYEALPAPEHLDRQLQEVVYARSKSALEAALKALEQAIEDGDPGQEQLAKLAARVEGARARLPQSGPYALEGLGLSAASYKRLAYVEFSLALLPGAQSEVAEWHMKKCHSQLQRASEGYRRAAIEFLRLSGETVQLKATLHWVLVQALSLATLLGDKLDGLGEDHWRTGRLSAEVYLGHTSIEERAWAHGSLAELWLLRLAAVKAEERAEIAARARHHAAHILRLFPGRGAFAVESTQRQFDRYVTWWGDAAFGRWVSEKAGVDRDGWEGEHGIVATAREIVELLDAGRAPRELGRRPGGGSESSGPGPAAAGGEPSGPAAASGEPSGPGSAPAGGGDSSAPRHRGGSGKLGGTPRRRRRTAGAAIFDLEMLPADYGDCLWIEYGDAADPSRVLIDCGPPSTFPRLKARIEALAEKDRRFELFVLSHIDNDHIGGTIPLFKDERLGVEFGDVWFNGWRHLPQDKLNAKQAEIFTTLVRDRKLPWNAAADGGPLVARSGGGEDLPVYTLPGGLRLTLLSPTRDRLAKLRVRWEKELRAHGLTPGSKVDYRKFLGGTGTLSTDVDALAESKFKSDVTPPNGSSIAFLAEFEGRGALFAADAHVPVLVDSIRALLRRRGAERLRCDLLKVGHHASQGNTSSELIDLLDCPRYLVSTSGARFHHPDRETIARLIKHGGERPEICFNYRSKDNRVWAREDLQERYGYRASYPDEELAGFRVSLV
jgi:CHAT domain/Metallo-beta-lactamase superfamily